VQTLELQRTSNVGVRPMRDRLIALVLATLVPSVSGLAQSDTDRQRDRLTIVARADLTAGNVMRTYPPDEAVVPHDAVLPLNLTFPAMFRRTFETMYAASPTFRRQCVRIANASGLRVMVRVSQSTTGNMRARTQFFRTEHGSLHAVVEIKPLQDQFELIAHELEHVIEQLDGVDLPSLAARPDSGVRECGTGVYETVRAMRIGVAVAQEVQRASN
jgi:hypothetical protein